MMLSVEQFSCRYRQRKKPTLTGVDLSIREGEMVLIAGRSGCGKSTLIKAVTGLLSREEAETSGSIFLGGENTADMTAETIGLLAGTVYQTPDDQLFAMTVWDEAAFSLENRGASPAVIRREVERALAKTGLSALAGHSIHALSGGQRQRLALAAVLVTHPKLLILDEPVSQMNPQGVQDFLCLLQRLNREEGMTILVVEHRVNELAPYFPRLAVMYEGHFIYDGPTEEAWRAIGSSDQYGLREPQTVRLGRELGLPVLSSSVEKTAEEIREAGISFVSAIPHEKTAPGTPLLEVRDLSYTYPGSGEETLHHISMTLEKGKIHALMGFNGAGKSTFLNLLSGLEKAEKGTLFLKGRPMEGRFWHVGYMRQEADLMLLTDTVAEEMKWNNPDLTEEGLDRLLHDLHLAHYRRDFPLALSKGQRLRAVLGAMLARRDNWLLLLDEPTTGQDQKSLSEIKRLLLMAAAEGRTVLLVTHDTELASEIAGEVFLMAGGRIIGQGTPRDVLGNRALLSAGGLSAPPMLALSEKLGIEPCITVEEVMRHVHAGCVGRGVR